MSSTMSPSSLHQMQFVLSVAEQDPVRTLLRLQLGKEQIRGDIFALSWGKRGGGEDCSGKLRVHLLSGASA